MKIESLFLVLLLGCTLAACQPKTIDSSKTTTHNHGDSGQAGLTWAGDKDPICGMKVDKTVKDTAHYGGKIYGFCNPGCKADFKKNPAKYIGN